MPCLLQLELYPNTKKKSQVTLERSNIGHKWHHQLWIESITKVHPGMMQGLAQLMTTRLLQFLQLRVFLGTPRIPVEATSCPHHNMLGATQTGLEMSCTMGLRCCPKATVNIQELDLEGQRQRRQI